MNRTSPELPAKLVYNDTQIKLLERLVLLKSELRRKTVGNFLLRLARFGGYLNRTRDMPLGNIVLWRGMARLTDIHIVYCLAKHIGD